MTKKIFAVAVLAVTSLVGQNTEPAIATLPYIQTQWEQLKQYLVLTEAQMTALEQIRQNRQRQEQEIHRQIAEKSRQMYTLLQQGSNDAATIGRLMVEINNLQRQLPLKGDTYRTEVLAQLTPAQKAKLPALTDALKLQSAAWQAIEFNMIDNPVVPDLRILPMPVEPLGGNGSATTMNSARSVR